MRRLEPEKVVKTLEALRTRICERFPGAGLATVAGDLVQAAQATDKRARAITRPFLFLRLAIVAIVAAGVALQLWAFGQVKLDAIVNQDVLALTQGLESLVNLLILVAAGVWFLMTLEQRVKRARVLAHLHELRSFAHVIDMHQLTKDPTTILSKGPRTSASPVREMSRFQLTRYLEYCAEMLALIGKLAAIYGERTPDTAVLGAVNDVESLCTDLGRKIWQKITILSALEDQEA